MKIDWLLKYFNCIYRIIYFIFLSFIINHEDVANANTSDFCHSEAVPYLYSSFNIPLAIIDNETFPNIIIN